MAGPAQQVRPEGREPGRRVALTRRRRAVIRRRRAVVLGLVAGVGLTTFAVTQGGLPFLDARSADGLEAVAVPPPAMGDIRLAAARAVDGVHAAVPDTPGGSGVEERPAVPAEPCSPQPGAAGVVVGGGDVGGAALGASALGCTMPAWQALPATTLEASEPEMLLAQVTREQSVDPEDYHPDDLVHFRDGFYELREEVVFQLDELFVAAEEAGHPLLTVTSGYRSYQTQAGTFEDWVGRLGQDRAEMLSARPGHSEHQLGLAVDLGGACNYQCFGDSDDGAWVAENAHRWGFIIRYPEGGETVTGYAWEPWHLRYVGPRAAWGMHLADEAYWENFQPVAARAAGLD